MAGIYIHIPFCKQACNYCNFHFSTSLHYKNDLLKAILLEIKMQQYFLENEKIETIYFGGGSPSILETDEVKRIIEVIYNNYNVGDLKEVTLEANPDDLSGQKIKELKNTVINRFSIGVQSFFDEDLIWMNRVHNSQQADRAIKTAQDAGFHNLTIDLIYGIPTLSNGNWIKNLSKALDLQVPHISAYALTVEEKTPLHKMISKHEKENVDEKRSAAQMIMLIETLISIDFEHYEISNFAKFNQYALHNTNYWKGEKYLGIGPSAHSFNGNERRWNVSNNQQYFQGIFSNKSIFENEILSAKDQFNEWLMTGLRTQWGCDLTVAKMKFDESWIKEILQDAEPYFNAKKMMQLENKLILTNEGKLIADRIISDLMIVK